MKRIFLLIVLLAMSVFLYACGGFYGHMGGRYGHMADYPFGGPPMWIFPLIFIAFLAFVVYLFVNKSNILKQDNPVDILKTRYAKGEITKEQFDEMKKKLEE